MPDTILDRDIVMRHGTLELWFVKGSIIQKDDEGHAFILPPKKGKKKAEGLSVEAEDTIQTVDHAHD